MIQQRRILRECLPRNGNRINMKTVNLDEHNGARCRRANKDARRFSPLAREFTIGRAVARGSDEITGIPRGNSCWTLRPLFGPPSRLCERSFCYRECILDVN